MRLNSTSGHLFPGTTLTSIDTRVRRGLVAISATAFVALCAHISIPLPFSPIPVTLQTFAVILIGFLLGPVDATAAMLLYLVEGAVGLPVFSPHGLGGVAQLLGPSGGYLLSYPLAAAVAGSIVRRFNAASTFVRSSIAGTFATLAVFLGGISWILTSLHLSLGAALHVGLLPFLPGEFIKLALSATVFTGLTRSR